jgi:hypothetical protein
MNTPTNLASRAADDFGGPALAQRLAAEFGPVLAQYGLTVVAVNGIEALLVCPKYALHFMADREGVEVAYIERDKKGLLAEFGLGHLFFDRFTDEDSARYGQPVGINEHIDASIRVKASGLINRCQDVLAGETGWIRRHAWTPSRPSAAVEQAVRSAGL